ncbi:hypothetical protein [Serratia fonticola]|uniref:hypothetical protein n=1 Tax=Serratia fonticola TaxID=47917 RepID=UPI00217C88AA|nr:hypothetical protein [Serratia fonticola]CAI1688489.1 Uncharacterised protein [Serratia fonticola]
MALLVGPLATRIGMPGVAGTDYLVAAVGLALNGFVLFIGTSIGPLCPGCPVSSRY